MGRRVNISDRARRVGEMQMVVQFLGWNDNMTSTKACRGGKMCNISGRAGRQW
jgi:hypothetical protein